MSNKKRHRIVVSGGKVQFLYNDKLQGLSKLGTMTAERASHVEPKTIDGKVRWTADMSPVGGPELDNDGKGYETREEALAVEVKWLEKNHLTLK